eukprot:TRINITY_DN901_c0_g3_i1.p1 TRINITY_DN901_c0_g3~~TRINITY_DN901_c0_g3_i1.p1  ORF type:complete len:399 (+),score=94.50 TRINITY_DN901_c0_g3_i1:83-1198(+)
MKSAFTLLLTLLAGAADATFCKKAGDPLGITSTVCKGEDLYIEFSGAPRYCTVLAFVPKNTETYFSYSWYYVRVGKPWACRYQSNCWATSSSCDDVDDQFAEKAKFYMNPAKYPIGEYEVRMYNKRSYYEYSTRIKVIDCNTDAPDTNAPDTNAPDTNAPDTDAPATSAPDTEAPVVHECVEASPALTYAKVDTTELMDGWSDSSFNLKHIPGEWFAGFTCRGTFNVPTGTTYTLKCPADSEYPCDWFVTHYHCPPCSSAENGGWPGILTTEGWESGSCGPRIVNPFHHETAIYRRQLAIGETVTIGPSVKPTKYLTFHMVPGADCSSLSVLECDSTKFCSVDGGRCIANWCPRRLIPQPARPPCTNCLGA